MALTVRPDDEVYQFDTVWLGPDEYTLPIQARYVAWGTWLTCFLMAAVVLIPLGGNGPAGVLGSLVWALGLSVLVSRAVMLVVDHERPLRSLPALFGAEARAAMAARRQPDRALLIRPGKIRVRSTPPRVEAMCERRRERAARRGNRGRPAPVAPEPVEAPAHGPDWREPGTPGPELARDPPVGVHDGDGPPGWAAGHQDRTERREPVPAWSVPTAGRYDEERHEDGYSSPYAPPSAHHAGPEPARVEPPLRTSQRTPVHPPADPTIGRLDRTTALDEQLNPGPITVTPHGGRHARGAALDDTRNQHRGRDPADRQTAVEARILLPARKDR